MPARALTDVPSDARAHLPSRDRRLIEQAASSAATADHASLLDGAAALAGQPRSIFAKLGTIARAGLPYGALVVDGFPIDRAHDDVEGGAVTEMGLLAVASALGTPIGYVSQRGGRLVHDLRPIREHAKEQLGTGSVELIWHTEEAHTELAPRFVVLLCIRGDASAGTLVSRVRRDLLPEAARERLEIEDFMVGSDASHEGASARRCAVLAPRRLTFDPLFTRCADADAEAALAVLGEHVDQHARQVVLQPGELMVIDNFAAAHARTAYAPRYDGTDRWLQRTVVLETPPPPECLVPGRPSVVAL